MKKIILLGFGLFLCGLVLKAQTVTMELKGKITQADDEYNVLNGAVKINDTFVGTIVYFTNVSDSNTDTTVGDYRNTQAPAGIEINIDSLTFRTDPGNVNFLVEAVNRPSNNSGDAVGMTSYKNIFPIGNNWNEKTINFQLDDPYGTALNSDNLFQKIDLNKFIQYYGLSIDAQTIGKDYFIRGLVTEITCTVRDINNNIIATNSSTLIIKTDPIVVDTTESVADFDGNNYRTVKIGNQTWLRDNLKSLHYSDGTAITGVSAYNNNSNNAAIYGRLYTWPATMHGSSSSIAIPSGVQGVCPIGWHVPSDNEWNTLIQYLGGTAEAGAQMKEKDTLHWKSPNAENTSLFSVLPAGYKTASGTYLYLGYDAAFWTTASYTDTYARYVFLTNNTTNATIYNDGDKPDSYSVRCIKNDTLPVICEANFTATYLTDSSRTVPTYAFTNLSSGNATSFLWSFGDGMTSTIKNPVHAYNYLLHGAIVNVRLQIRTSLNCVDTFVQTIVIPGNTIDSCLANFTYIFANDSVSSGLPLRTRVYFTDASTSNGTITYRNWFFGDGTASTLQNPSHVYNFAHDTTVSVGLFIGSAGCGDSIFKNILIPGYSTSYSIAGTVVGNNELLKQGVIVLYKKAINGLFKIANANIISDGSFNFGQLSAGSYIIYVLPDIYYSNKYLPTYYVNKLHWADAQVINLSNNLYGLKLQLVSAYTIATGPGKISGTVTSTGAAFVEQSALKSAASYSYPVNLIGESGETLLSTTPDELGNFAFDNLPYGKYSVNIEYPNISNQNLTVNLSPESPVATDLKIVIDESATSVNSLTKEAKAVIYNVSTDQIAVGLNNGGKYNMSLISMTGRVILNGQIDFESNTDKIISIGSLPNGIYLIKLQNNASIITEKIFR
jgi:uncharacterized protein (TIGR02145 family)